MPPTNSPGTHTESVVCYEQLYGELHRLADRLMKGERAGHTLQPTALVNEAFLRLEYEGFENAESWRALAFAARAMRQALIDHARKRAALKRGGDRGRIVLDTRIVGAVSDELDVLELHEAIECLAELDVRKARVVEMKFFSRMTHEQIALAVDVSAKTVEADWYFARGVAAPRASGRGRMSGTDRFQEVAHIFEACRMTSSRERMAILREMCGSDEPLRLEIEELLDAHDREADPIRTAGGSGGQDEGSLDDESEPRRIGRYTIQGRLGAGGMGVVYRASQDAPRREVALKVLPGSMLSHGARARFDAEAQTLGRLDHPSIARIYEAGVEAGEQGHERPFFAMELVHGTPLTTATAGMTIPERLQLLALVCDAVQHAHQRGVIHRDLKPSNILVDDAGEPHVLDFGIARLIEDDAERREVNTQTGHILGTVQYMSPEQASGEPSSIDTRSDVYSLGVLLYQSLAGKPPYDATGVPMLRALRRVAEAQPEPLPDLRTSHQADLQTIVAKSLAKDQSLRYQTASELAEDLRRTCRNEPILAHPPSTVYHLKKFISRNRPLVALACAAGLAVAAGGIAVSVGFSRASTAENIAVTRLAEAQRETRKAEAVRDFLRNMLASVDPKEMNDRDITVREILDVAQEELLDGAMASEPGVRGAVLHTLGHTYRGLGLPDEAEALLQEAVSVLRRADDQYELSMALTALGGVNLTRGEYKEAEVLYREALSTLRALPVPPAEIPVTMDGLGLAVQGLGSNEDALAIFEKALVLHIEHSGRASLRTATCLNNVAFAQYYLNDFDAAAEGFEEVLEIQLELVEEGHPDVLRTMANLGATYEQTGRFEEALRIHEKSHAMRLASVGPDHPDMFYAHVGLANSKRRLKDYVGSLPHYDDAIRVVQSVYGDSHRNEGSALFQKGQSLRALKRYEEAWDSFRSSAAIRDANGDFKVAAEALDTAAYIRQTQQNYDAALEELQGVIEYQQQHLPNDAEFEATVQLSLGLLHIRTENFDQAIIALTNSVSLRRSVYGEVHGRIGEAMCRLGYALLHSGRFNEAEQTLREAEAVLVEAIHDKHWLVGETRASLGQCLLETGKPSEGAGFMEQGYGLLGPTSASQSRLASICADLARAHGLMGNTEAAEQWSALSAEHLAADAT